MNWVFLVITSLVVACALLSLLPHSMWVPDQELNLRPLHCKVDS